ncbi:hypothetical protein TL16_g05221 [Triparma laevis f. inornata]|uniref:Uncharacterized protein n=2 Tax=Triparma laevis TaxID=1534972 RepID=A0A9W7AC31_9STRA|nr:hypothetical protein TL16_g05221 [Triparma laevis f. inornata]GMH69951.1 hypothetical protein TrLO_g14443 [Triparma laevis f. longispina]
MARSTTSSTQSAAASEPPLTKSQVKNRAKKAKKATMAKLTETERREQGYLQTAGLKSSPTSSTPISLSPDSSELKFARNLGASSQKTRHRTALGLKKYITARSNPKTGSGFSEFDFMKLQKALFYCVWLSDKVAVQEELTDLIAPLLHACGGEQGEDIKAGEEYLIMMEEDGEEDEDNSFDDDEEDDDEINFKDNDEGNDDDDVNSTDSEDSSAESNSPYLTPHCGGVHLSTIFLSTFFRTLSHEWGGIDQYRLDKIYSLIRKIIRQMYEYIAKRSFHPGVVAQFNDVLVEEVLEKTPNGLRFHVIDICLDELSKVADYFDTLQFVSVVEPFTALAQAETDKFVRGKVFENIFLKFLTKYSKYKDEPEVEDEEDEKTVTFYNVDVKEVAKFLFEVASSEATLDSNRRMIYDMQKTYEKRIRKSAPAEEKEKKEEAVVEKKVVVEEEETQVKPEKSKRKGKTPKKREASPNPTPEPESVGDSSSTTPPPQKKRRASVDITEMRDSDEDYSSPPADSQKRRVSFGKNKSKSWTKSMNDMHKKDVIISPKPKRGLLKKGMPVVVAKEGKGKGSRKSKRNGGH